MGKNDARKETDERDSEENLIENLHLNIQFDQDHEEWILRKQFNCNENFKTEHYMDNLEKERGRPMSKVKHTKGGNK